MEHSVQGHRYCVSSCSTRNAPCSFGCVWAGVGQGHWSSGFPSSHRLGNEKVAKSEEIGVDDRLGASQRGAGVS